jgi:hypothetical protein
MNMGVVFFFLNKRLLLPIAIHIEVLNREVEWLMGLPFGFKTNRQLNSMLGKFITFFILLW